MPAIAPAPRPSLLVLCIAGALAPTPGSAAPLPQPAAAVAATDLDRVVVEGERPSGYATPATSAGTGLSLDPRETPQSVSVVGREQLDDFGLDDLNEALESTTGVNVERVETGRTYFTVRGFDVTNFQRDGLGVPLPYGIQNGDVDTALFERIEVLRGANGLMSGTGNPSATVNFVRKRPTGAFEAALQGTVGSWDRRRVDADVSGPLGAGTVRGRAVAAWEEVDSHLDRHSLEKGVGYGVLEADLSDATVLTLGASRQRNRAESPLWGALPLYYTDGTPTGFDASTSTAADWSYWITEDTRAFTELSQGFGNGWSITGAFNWQRATEDSELFYVYGTPDRETGLGLFSYPSMYQGDVQFQYADVRATGPVAIGGREHDLLFGAGWSDGNIDELSRFPNDIGTPLPALEDFRGDYPKPPFHAFSDGSDFDYRRDTVYATARWNLADSFKLVTGANHAKVRMDGFGYGEPKSAEASRTTPFVGAVWDFASRYSAYASHGGIFAQQSQLDATGNVLDPIEGTNTEVGVKGEWFGGMLNASLAAFRVEQDNLAEYAGFDLVQGRSFYEGRDARSTGWEIDIAGRLTDTWSLAGGFTHLDIEDPAGGEARTYVPRNMLRLVTIVELDAVPGLRVGANLRWQDDIHREQSLVVDGSPVVTRQEAYAVLGLMAGYRSPGGWEATLNLDNVTDETYIPSLYWEQGYYAAPRSVSLALGYHF